MLSPLVICAYQSYIQGVDHERAPTQTLDEFLNVPDLDGEGPLAEARAAIVGLTIYKETQNQVDLYCKGALSDLSYDSACQSLSFCDITFGLARVAGEALEKKDFEAMANRRILKNPQTTCAKAGRHLFAHVCGERDAEREGGGEDIAAVGPRLTLITIVRMPQFTARQAGSTPHGVTSSYPSTTALRRTKSKALPPDGQQLNRDAYTWISAVTAYFIDIKEDLTIEKDVFSYVGDRLHNWKAVRSALEGANRVLITKSIGQPELQGQPELHDDTEYQDDEEV
jgi:hypothetical protein